MHAKLAHVIKLVSRPLAGIIILSFLSSAVYHVLFPVEICHQASVTTA